MNWKSQIYKNGFIMTIDESGNKNTKRKPKNESQNKINICLNCTKNKCNGTCNEIRRKRNGK